MSFQKIQACFCVYRISFKRSNILIATIEGLIVQNSKIRHTSFIHHSIINFAQSKWKASNPSIEQMTNKNMFQFIPSIFQAFKRSIIQKKTKKNNFMYFQLYNPSIFQSFIHSKKQYHTKIFQAIKRSSDQPFKKNNFIYLNSIPIIFKSFNHSIVQTKKYTYILKFIWSFNRSIIQSFYTYTHHRYNIIHSIFQWCQKYHNPSIVQSFNRSKKYVYNFHNQSIIQSFKHSKQYICIVKLYHPSIIKSFNLSKKTNTNI